MKKRIQRSALLALAATDFFALPSCTDAQRAKVGGLGDEFKVELYSGGKKVREWTSTGKVSNEENTDGYYFKDKDSGKLIEVSGDVVITKL